MIFVAVGTQFAFDRLVRCVDEWAAINQVTVQAQIAEGEYIPKHAQWERFMTTAVFNQHLEAASLIVSHAGMGNIITALEKRKPIIVMNRQSVLGEHRNDHQSDGLEWMSQLPGVFTARSCEELRSLLKQASTLTASDAATSNERRARLISFLDQAIRS
ncbi:glycosyltransferase [Thiolinea disciformis]|uniref:glycosyltransferase n=1 Tax=Thiolinea disciformis TaxID=125614 RepID=UPI00036BBBA4|nr:glycosyltransferase [Thiolinea disciformis]